MNQTVTLLLLLSGELAQPTPEERRALATFQTREKVTLAAPVAGLHTSTPPNAGDVALRIEALLDEAQTLAASLDEERALVLLQGVERELLLHPELPQAAWLMAERHQVTAAIRRKQPGGADEAARLVASARALEGPRAASFGEGVEAALPPTPVAPASTLLTVLDLDPADVFVLDGQATNGAASVTPGRHHARVLRGSSVAWFGWLDVSPEARVDKLLGVPERVACSRNDLRDVASGARSPSVPGGVHCARWVAVRRGRVGLEVAWCEGARCTAYGPLLHESVEKPRPSIPAWIAATIVGATAVGAGTLLIATGTFERERPAPVQVTRYRGPK